MLCVRSCEKYMYFYFIKIITIVVHKDSTLNYCYEHRLEEKTIVFFKTNVHHNQDNIFLYASRASIISRIER